MRSSVVAEPPQDGRNPNQPRFQNEKLQSSGKSLHPATALASPAVNASANAFLHDQDPKVT
jgi:hypothetical protein